MEQTSKPPPPFVTPGENKKAKNNEGRLHFKCPCSISYCNSGAVQKLLLDAGCHDMLDPRTVEIVDYPSTHPERKSYALCRSVEHHLSISQDTKKAKREAIGKTNKKYYQLHKFHWPASLVLKTTYRPSRLLNINEVKAIIDDQSREYGITSTSLQDKCNLYSTLISKVIQGTTCLSALEQSDLKCYVQAPVATKDHIKAYINF